MTRERVGGFYVEGSRFNGWRVWPIDGDRATALWFAERQLAIAYARLQSEMAVTG